MSDVARHLVITIILNACVRLGNGLIELQTIDEKILNEGVCWRHFVLNFIVYPVTLRTLYDIYITKTSRFIQVLNC